MPKPLKVEKKVPDDDLFEKPAGKPRSTAPAPRGAAREAGYTAAEHGIWDRLFAQQIALLRTRAAPEFLAGVGALGLSRPGIPDFERLSERLMKATGWQVVAVPGLIPAEAFFDHLANRRFVAGNFIRTIEQIDYLEEPDVFHDVFGHVPLLALPEFADYMQAYGRGGLRAARLGATDRLSRLYWYTVEFGLVRSRDGLRIYGSGIASSRGETIYALDDPAPNRIGFDLERVMRTPYRIDDFSTVLFRDRQLRGFAPPDRRTGLRADLCAVGRDARHRSRGDPAAGSALPGAVAGNQIKRNEVRNSSFSGSADPSEDCAMSSYKCLCHTKTRTRESGRPGRERVNSRPTALPLAA